MSWIGKTTSDVDCLVKEAADTGTLGFDVESNHGAVHRPDWCVWGMGLSSGKRSLYFSSPSTFLAAAEAVWEFPGDVIAHNASFDLRAVKKSARLRGYPKKPVCTMIGLNLLDEKINPKALGLKPTMLRQFRHEMMTYEEAVAFGKDSEEFAAYCCDDAFSGVTLWNWEKPQLEAEQLMRIFRKVYCKTIKTAADMELFGFGWDLETGRSLLYEFQKVADSARDEILELISTEISVELAEKINLTSRDQLAKLLFAKKKDGGFGISTAGISKTKSGKRHQVDEKVLTQLAAAGYPIAMRLRERQFATDQIIKYVWKISKFAMEDPNSRVHPSIWLTSGTGRTRMSDPPNQTITKYPPKRFQKDPENFKVTFAPQYEIRSGYMARDGHIFIITDMSGCQLRLNAHICPDPEMIRAFCSWKCTACGATGSHNILLMSCPECGAAADEGVLKGKPDVKGFWHGADLHQETFEFVNSYLGRPILESRQDGKVLNFSLIFGATAYKMHMEHPKYSIEEWDAIIGAFFAKYKGTKRYHIKIENIVDRLGVINSAFGRKKRFTPAELEGKSRKHALNQAYNFSAQCDEVHWAELAMSKLYEWGMEAGYHNDGRVENYGFCTAHFNHDELVTECPLDLVPIVKEKQEEFLRYCVELSVPMDVETKISKRWS